MANGRLDSLDSIRGIAILGILFMNLLSIATPFAAYDNPHWHSQGSFTDTLVYSFQHLFFDGRFMSLFCLLLGAGLALLWDKCQQRGYPPKNVIYRRLRWLLLFGFLHGVFIWFGDILFSYALAGLFVVASGMLKRDGGKLIKIGVTLFVAGLVVLTAIWLAFPLIPEEFAAEMTAGYQLSTSELADDTALWTGPYIWQLIKQLILFIGITSSLLFLGAFWSFCGMMTIGIGLYRIGIFHNGLHPALQWTLLAIGLSVSGADLYLQWDNNFQSPRNMYSPWNMIAALPVALAYLSLLAKFCQRRPNPLPLFANVGRMAFTFYIFQSVTMVLLFRWLAPQLYGQLDRLSLLGIAIAMSVLQIILASIWLKHYEQGPLEKMWRALTYRKLNTLATQPAGSKP